MRRIKLPKSLRRWVRTEKARIRKEGATPKEAGAKIEEMYKKITDKKR